MSVPGLLSDIGVRAGGWGEGSCSPPPPQIGGNSELLGSKRNLVLKDVFKLFLIDRYFLFLPKVGNVKPVKFTRDSGCLARDELLVISKGDHLTIRPAYGLLTRGP